MKKRIAVVTAVLCAVFITTSMLSSETFAQSKKDRRRAEKLLAEGDTYYRQKDYNGAILRYARALAIVPQYPLAHYNKGRAHFNLRQYPEAITEFGNALNQGYDARSIYAIRWRAYFALKQFDKAMEDAQAGHRTAPDDPYFYIAEGQVRHEQKDFRGALNAYQRAIDLGTKNPNISYLMALSYNRLGNWQKQEELAKKALDSATTLPDMAWFLLGDAQQRLRKYEDAINSYENAKSVNPNLYGIYINLAECHKIQNRLREAILVAEEGIKKFPDDVSLHINVSWYYSLAGRNELAITFAKKAIQLAPNQYLGYTNLCRAYNDTNQLQLALQNCNKALELRPGDGETNFYLGRTYQLLKDSDKAYEHYEKAVEGLETFTKANPNYADGFYLLGNAYTVTGSNSKAISAYQTSLQIAPLFSRARFNLGLMYLRENEVAKARQQAAALQTIDAQLAKKLQEVIDQ